MLCGARSFLAIGQWAKGLPKEALKRFGARRDEPPSEPTIRKTIHSIDAGEFDRRISNWLIIPSTYDGAGKNLLTVTAFYRFDPKSFFRINATDNHKIS